MSKYLILALFLVACNPPIPCGNTFTIKNLSSLSDEEVLVGGNYWSTVGITFNLVDPEDEADVTVAYLSPSSSVLGLTKRSEDKIFVVPGADAFVVAHELGHWLGLGHDKPERQCQTQDGIESCVSICNLMNANYCDTDVLSDADIALFNKVRANCPFTVSE